MMTKNYTQLRSICFAAAISLSAVLTFCFDSCYANSIFPNFTATPKSFADVAEKTMPSVVNISTTQKLKGGEGNLMFDLPGGEEEGGEHNTLHDMMREFLEREFSGPRARKKRAHSLGSGFIIDSAGYIVTNYHVIDGADEITVTLADNDNKKYDAKVIGKDEKTDIVLLKIEANKPLPYVEFADSDEARVGDWVITVGNPFNLGSTVTAGIISAKARYLNTGFDDFIQTDAPINRGNSGGPMFNLDGKVIGVNSVIITPSGGSIGLGFAIPSNLVQSVIKQLKEHGKVVRGWLGVMIQPVTDEIASNLGIKEPHGALISEVVKDGPADKAGFKLGDLITKFDNKKVIASTKLPKMVADVKIGSKVPVEVIRNGKTVTLTATIEKPAATDGSEEEASSGAPKIKVPSKTILGMTLCTLDGEMRKKYKIDDKVRGVIITKIDYNSPARDIGLRVGDVIMSFSNVDVHSIEDLDRLYNAARTAGKENAILLVWSKKKTVFLVINFE
jgi:serine protease Do